MESEYVGHAVYILKLMTLQGKEGDGLYIHAEAHSVRKRNQVR